MKVLSPGAYKDFMKIKRQALINKIHADRLKLLDTYVFLDGKPVQVGKGRFYVIEDL